MKNIFSVMLIALFLAFPNISWSHRPNNYCSSAFLLPLPRVEQELARCGRKLESLEALRRLIEACQQGRPQAEQQYLARRVQEAIERDKQVTRAQLARAETHLKNSLQRLDPTQRRMVEDAITKQKDAFQSRLKGHAQEILQWQKALDQRMPKNLSPEEQRKIVDQELQKLNLMAGRWQQDYSKPTPPRFLIDISGVDWTGGARENDWGGLLSRDKRTIYVRHQGPGIDKWDTPKEPDAIAISLPDNWDERSAGQLLLPYLKLFLQRGKMSISSLTKTSHWQGTSFLAPHSARTAGRLK